MTSRPATRAGERGTKTTDIPLGLCYTSLSTMLVSTNRKVTSQEEEKKNKPCGHAVVMMEFPQENTDMETTLVLVKEKRDSFGFCGHR